MFIIREILIEDKHLTKFLQAAAGYVHSMSPPMPVVNMTKNGTADTDSGYAYDLFYNHLIKHKIREFHITDVQKFLPTIGKNPTSANYVIQMLRDTKRVKSDPKRRSFHFVI